MGLENATYVDGLVTSNPVGANDPVSQGDDHLRLLKTVLKNSFPGTDKPTRIQQPRVNVASGTTTDIGAATSDNINITGTATIESFGTAAAGTIRRGTFAAAATLEHDATELLLPGAANIVTATGDRFEALSLGSGNWVVLNFHRANGKPVVPPDVGDIPTLSGTIAVGTAARPVGIVEDYAGSTEPNGWLFCRGQAISRTTYSALFDIIGVTYGVGDNVNTFNLPDLRGRTTVGRDDMGGAAANRVTNAASGITGTTLGANGGAQTHTLTTAQMPAHRHLVVHNSQGNTGDMTSPDQSMRRRRSSSGDASTYELTQTPSEPDAGRTTSVGGGAAHNNMQPSLILNKIIWTGVIA